jgi:glycine/D-amino acid oxidase-like deaminating enzyme/nitrite reductase/ring-hydroxylating ferredoxin subunit
MASISISGRSTRPIAYEPDMALLEARKNTSLWVDTTPDTDYPPLGPGRHFDVAVLGGGMAGLTTAYLLERQGASVAVIEAGRVAAGVTAYTTAKVSALQGTIYSTIEGKFGAEGARTYAAASQLAKEWMRGRVDELGIDCDWRAKPAYTYAEDASDVAKVEREVEAAGRAGLAATYTTETDLPWPVEAAVRVDDQAEFHPRKYLLALAAALDNVFEQTRATAVSAGSPNRVLTTRGELTADDVVVATHFPFLDRAGFFARMHPERSYGLGIYLKRGATPPQGMYLSTESPVHTIRSHPTADGEMLIAGGESHKTGQGGDTAERVQRLEAWARARFDVRSIEYRWSTQDNMPVDSLPYIGRMLPFQRGIWVATGFMKWGLTSGTAAGLLLADLIAGRPNDWADLFDATRIKPVASAAEFVKENANVGKHFVGDHLSSPDARSLDEVPRGEGRLVRRGAKKVAAYRDDDDALHVVSAICTHLGCQVKWNSAERSWDCPCHGSRFGTDGTVLQGPAVADLPPADDT